MGNTNKEGHSLPKNATSMVKMNTDEPRALLSKPAIGKAGSRNCCRAA